MNPTNCLSQVREISQIYSMEVIQSSTISGYAFMLSQNSDNKLWGLFLDKGPFQKYFLGGAYIWRGVIHG